MPASLRPVVDDALGLVGAGLLVGWICLFVALRLLLARHPRRGVLSPLPFPRT
jgi:hypothetical protein